MSSGDPDDFDIEDLIDTASELIDLYDQNSEKINNIVGKDQTVKVSDSDLLNEVRVEDEMVKIVMETAGPIEKVGLTRTGGGVSVAVNNDSITFETPEDVVVDGAEAEMNNSILTIEIPRGE